MRKNKKHRVYANPREQHDKSHHFLTATFTARYGLCTYPGRHFDEMKCILESNDYDFIRNDIIYQVYMFYKDYFKDSDDPVINFYLVEFYEDGGHMTKVGGVIKPHENCLYGIKAFNRIVDGVNNYVV